ncbi:hypothetical protein EX30DRAFT_344333 [Ascodesmis nigricans]|uniref:Uncharacterized protein n=1 Tax=Ascodesmis nigricans TaxID=341454 RepID=A0A4S2MR06_9PEZI|nr:hypothetical protein EX30DRAFT_344333 [Ascodesmis nigricans]
MKRNENEDEGEKRRNETNKNDPLVNEMRRTKMRRNEEMKPARTVPIRRKENGEFDRENESTDRQRQETRDMRATNGEGVLTTVCRCETNEEEPNKTG